MKFYDYHDDTARMLKRFGKGSNMARADIYNMVMNHPDSGTFAIRHAMWERDWIAAGRPYYDLYPSLIEPFAKLNLDIRPTTLQPPGGLRNLLVRFPEHADNKTARTMFISWQNTRWKGTSLDGQAVEPFIVVGGDFGERDDGGLMVASVYAPPPDDSKTLQAWLDVMPYSDMTDGCNYTTLFQNDQQALFKLVRIACCLCLLNNNPDLITPQVLNRDADKARNATPEELEALAARARANGRHGYSVGAALEHVPHMRRPHLAIYHTGKGRTVPVIKMRKGSVVQRKKMTEVPTGFLGGDQ